MCYSQCGCWWYLCACVALGFGATCSLLYLVENRAWLVMFLCKQYRPLSFQTKFRLGSVKVSLSTGLNDFHSGLLSTGPEESADGDHDHHHHHHELQCNCINTLSSKPLATGRPTSNSHGRGRSRPQPQGGGGQGGTHTTRNHNGEGGDTMGWGGGRGGLAALHHFYTPQTLQKP